MLHGMKTRQAFDGAVFHSAQYRGVALHEMQTRYLIGQGTDIYVIYLTERKQMRYEAIQS